MGIDVECEAEWMLRPLGDVPSARRLAEHHLGPKSVMRVPRRILKEAPAATWPMLGRPTIFIREGLSDVEVRWNICHELAEWRLEAIGYTEPDVELVAEALAAALVAPRLSFRAHVSRLGHDLPKLAESFTTTQTAVALRLAEARCVEASAVVRPGLVRVRAPDGFVMPGESELRKAATTGREGLERHVLTDARRRVALVAA